MQMTWQTHLAVIEEDFVDERGEWSNTTMRIPKPRAPWRNSERNFTDLISSRSEITNKAAGEVEAVTIAVQKFPAE